MFDFVDSCLPDCQEIRPRVFEDERGRFIKTFHRDLFHSRGIDMVWRENYYTTSRQGVLRGLHFQTPPHDHAKLVYCSSGEVLDVVVDLRVGSPTYGKFATFNLSSEKANMIYIPKGMAHGFCTVSLEATMNYLVETVYAPQNDEGILWNSVGIRWPVENPLLSPRDKTFPRMDDFMSPFSFKEIPGCDG